MAMAVDEERRSSCCAAGVAAGDVALDSQRMSPLMQVVGEAIAIESERVGVAQEVCFAQRPLVGEEQVVHLPEPALRAGGFRGLGGAAGVLVHLRKRQVAKHIGKIVAEGAGELPQDRFRAPAMGALEVGVPVSYTHL